MGIRQRQAGMSMPGMLIIAIMVGFYVLCFIKMMPVYTEYLTIKQILTTVSEEHVPGSTTTAEMRRRLENLYTTNQIYDHFAKDVEVYRKKGKTYIDGNYEGRVNIVGRIDVVMRFDDLMFVAGEPQPQ